MDSFTVWGPAPEDETRVLIRCHPLAPYKPRQRVSGDYIFFTQETEVLLPGEQKVLSLDCDITTFGQVHSIEWPLPGPVWYHPSMGQRRCCAEGYHRLFDVVKIVNVHPHSVIIPEGTPICRIIMDVGNIDYEEYTGNPYVPTPSLSMYRAITSEEAYRLGLCYYNNSDAVNFTPIEAPLHVLRGFTYAANANINN